MSWARGGLERIWAEWRRFWFESNEPESMRLFRRLFGALMFLFFALRTPDLRQLYSESGVLPVDLMREVLDFGSRQSIFFHARSETAIWVGHAALLASTAAMALGFFPRASALLAYLLHVSFLHRNMTVAYGIDSISVFFFLNLIIADTRRRDSMLGSVSLRLCQLQVCVIYFYSGLEKLKGTHWWYGDAIWRVLANHQLASMDFTWVTAFPLLVVLSTWGTLVWEVYFPALIWLPRWRFPMLLFGVAMHLGIALSMSIPFFGFLMIFAYVTFLTDVELARFSVLIRSFLQHMCKK